MLLRFSRDEAARALALPVDAVHALVRAGVLRETHGAVAADDLEMIFRDSLLRLYRAEAGAAEIEVDIPAAADADQPAITHNIAEFLEPPEQEKPNLRLAPRYVPRRQIGGTFRQVRFTILQLSATGMRIRHDDTLRPGDEARLTFAIVKPARSFAIRARVVWTSIAQRGDSPSFCISGVTAIGGDEQLRDALRILLAARELEVETAPTKRSSISGLADEDVAEVIRASRLLSCDPIEANRWYSRARYAIADDDVRKSAPSRPRDREEVVAIWEYLGRRIDLRAISAVIAWIRQTRAASAAPALSV